MKRIWLGCCILLMSGFVAAQQTSETSVERSAAATVINKDELQQMVSKLAKGQNQQDVGTCFMDKEAATDFVAKVFAGTENGHQPERKEAVSAYYHSLSSKAAAYFTSLIPNLEEIRVVEAWVRPGATDLMRVIVLKLDVLFADGTSHGQRVNVVETDKGYKILNLED